MTYIFAKNKMCGDQNPGLQITVGHRTMADKNLPMSDEIPTVVGHASNVRTIVFAFQRKC